MLCYVMLCYVMLCYVMSCHFSFKGNLHKAYSKLPEQLRQRARHHFSQNYKLCTFHTVPKAFACEKHRNTPGAKNPRRARRARFTPQTHYKHLQLKKFEKNSIFLSLAHRSPTRSPRNSANTGPSSTTGGRVTVQIWEQNMPMAESYEPTKFTSFFFIFLNEKLLPRTLKRKIFSLE